MPLARTRPAARQVRGRGLAALGVATLLLCVAPRPARAQSSLPRIQIKDLRYAGAFRVSSRDFGPSNLNYSQGPIAYDASKHSLFIVGHAHQQAVAELAIPALVNSADVAKLNLVRAALQPFAGLLGRAASGNSQAIDRVGGMFVVNAGGARQLVVNAYEYYDAPGDNTHTTLVARDASKLATCKVDGYFRLPGAAHASGWISPIPAQWQAALGGTHIVGNSSGEPIISRLSVGPSAYAVDLVKDVLGATTAAPIKTTKLLGYSLQNPLHADLDNKSGNNKLWTHLSRATYGLIVPGTRTYLTVGHSGGHGGGVCYKCRGCGGYCSVTPGDGSQYYWLFDVNDLVAVKNGKLAAHAVRPYAYGKLSTAIPNGTIGGGALDAARGLLYLSLPGADRLQGQYANPPVIVAYKLPAGGATGPAPDSGSAGAADAGAGPGADAGSPGAGPDAGAGSGTGGSGTGGGGTGGNSSGGAASGPGIGAGGDASGGCVIGTSATAPARATWMLLALAALAGWRRRRR